MSRIKTIFSILSNSLLWKNVAALLLASFIIISIIGFWLKSYTHHGQQLVMPNYVGQNIDLATTHAANESFKMVIVDSVFVVGKRGGQILRQTPHAGDVVKQDRKIYVSITKYDADRIQVSQLPILYGKNFKRKKKELKQGYELNSKIKGYLYDPGPADHILLGIYKGDTIVSPSGRKDHIELEAGSTIQFVLSKKKGGLLELPDLLCKTYSEAQFILESYQAKIQIIEDGKIKDLEQAYVWKQHPAVGSSKAIEMGSSFELYLTQERPSFCPDFEL